MTQNHCNSGKRSNNTSGFKGVVFRKDCPLRPWVAQIGVGKWRKNIGHFTNQEDAARAYDEVAVLLHGEFARLNFPTKEKI